MLNRAQLGVIVFTTLYLIGGAVYFLRDLNFEFVIYVGVLAVIFAAVFGTVGYTKFPGWMLLGLSIWGLLHILGGSFPTPDGVLFAYHIYPFFDGGGELYILKYDQVVHAYLYGLIAIMAYHIIRTVVGVRGKDGWVFLIAILLSVGVGALNEIMEFIISLNMTNGVGGYYNTMLDLCFNLGGAFIALIGYLILKRR